MGFLALVGALGRVVAGVSDPVSVAGEDLEVNEVVDAVERIGQQGAGVLEKSRGGVAAEASRQRRRRQRRRRRLLLRDSKKCWQAGISLLAGEKSVRCNDRRGRG